MRAKRYNKPMKLHKKLLLVAASVLVLGAGGTSVAFAMQPEEPKKVVETPQVASVETEAEVAPVVETPEPAPQPVVQPVAVETPAEPQETLKDEIKRRVEELAISRGLNDVSEYHQNQVPLQSYCMDMIISAGEGYENETWARAQADRYLVGKVTDDGKVRKMAFRSGCGIYTYTPES